MTYRTHLYDVCTAHPWDCVLYGTYTDYDDAILIAEKINSSHGYRCEDSAFVTVRAQDTVLNPGIDALKRGLERYGVTLYSDGKRCSAILRKWVPDPDPLSWCPGKVTRGVPVALHVEGYVFARNPEHAFELAEEFHAKGIPADNPWLVAKRLAEQDPRK